MRYTNTRNQYHTQCTPYRNDRNNNRRVLAKKANQRIILMIMAAICMIVFCVCMFSNFSSAKTTRPSYKYYTSVQIESGDTLWTVADRYMSDEYHDKTEYIYEVKQLNHMTSDNIQSGDYIMVPYYSYEVK